jgi:HprK-related kinase A
MIGLTEPRPALGETRHFGIGEIGVSLRSELDEASQDFTALYRACRREAAPDSETIHMEVRAEPRTLFRARRYSICADGQAMFKQRRSSEVLPYLEWGICWRLIARHPGFLQCHAATMMRSGRGVILAGDSGVGKSTLAAGLLARGWQYLSDEFALIDPETLRLHPFPKALCIKSGAFELIERLKLPLWCRRPYVKAMKGRVGYVSPPELPSGTADRPAPAGLVIFPRYTEKATPRLRPMPRAEAAFSLARCSFNRGVYGQRAIAILSRLLREAECYRLDAGALDPTCDLVESLV